MNKYFKHIVTASAGILLVASPLAVSAADPIAKVGDTEITKETFYEEMKASAGESVLNELILKLAFEKYLGDTKQIKKDLEEQVKEEIEATGGEESFASLLAYQNLGTIETFKNALYIQNMATEAVKKSLDTSDESLKKFYDEEYAPNMEARHILVEEKKEAEAVIKRLNDGEDFAEVAKDVSIDPTAADGGTLPPFKEGDMVEPFEKAIKKSKNGEISKKPVETEYGFHVIETIHNGEKPAFEDVKDDLVDEMVQAKLQDTKVIQEFFNQILNEAGVEIFDEDLKHLMDLLVDDVDVKEASDAKEE